MVLRLTPHQFDVLTLLESRNEQEDLKAEQIQKFATQIGLLFGHIKNSDDGRRLMVKIRSNVPEEEIYEDFSRLYRKYKILNRKKVGDYFFKTMDDLVNKLCDDFELTVHNGNSQEH